MEKLIADALYIIQAGEPYRTGNLKRSFQVVRNEDGFTIYTDCEYMVFTNEVWLNRGGRTNPHQWWFDERVEMICDYIASIGGGGYVIK